MSFPSIRNIVGGIIKPLLPDQWQDKVSMHLFYCSAYQNYKRGLYQNTVDDLNIVVSQAKRFGSDHLLAEAYLLRGFSYSRLADMKHAEEDIVELDRIDHPYETILGSWLIYLKYDSREEVAANVLAAWFGYFSTDKLVKVSANGFGVQLLDPVDELAWMYSGCAQETLSAGRIGSAAKVLKKFSEYLQKMAENGYDASRFLPATNDLYEKLVNIVGSLIDDAEYEEATAESAAIQYRLAYDIASSGCVVFSNDPELRYLKGRTARRLSAQVNGDEAQQLLKEAVDGLGAAIEESGGITAAVKDVNKKGIVKEYAIAKSEYAKYFIDNRRTLKKEYIKELLKESEKTWLLLEKEYPEEKIEILLNRLWVMYRRGKLEKDHSPALNADAVPEIYKNILSSSADDAKKSEIARLYMWFVLEEANMKIEELGEAAGAEAARELFLVHNIDDILEKAEKYTKGERWPRDLVWGKEGREQIMGDILMAGGKKQEAFKCYRTALRHLDTLWEKDHRKWMVSHYRGLVRMRMGFYIEAVVLLKEALSAIPVSEEERVWKTKKALWQALEKRTTLEDPPLEEKFENIVRMAELAVDNIEKCEERDVDPLKYLKDAVLPSFKSIGQHGLCGKARYEARIAMLLARAGIANINLRSEELGTLLLQCSSLML